MGTATRRGGVDNALRAGRDDAMLIALADYLQYFTVPWIVSLCAVCMAALGIVIARRTDTLGAVMVCLGGSTIALVWSVRAFAGQSPILELTAISASCLALLWLAAAAVIQKWMRRRERIQASFAAVAYILAVVAAGIILFVIGWTIWLRLTRPDAALASLNADGLIPLTFVGITILLAMRVEGALSPTEGGRYGVSSSASGSTALPAALIFTAALAVAWTSLMIPSVPWGEDIPPPLRAGLQPGWWTWSFHLMASLSVLIVLGAIVQDVSFRRRRAKAWPDRLELLLEPYSRWSGYARVESVLAAIVLVLGVFQVVRLSAPGWPLPTATALCALSAGVACFYMAYRRWSGNTALLGMTLMSLSYVGVAIGLATPLFAAPGADEYARRMPIILNAVLFGLWVAIAHWRWLARFWQQQLLDGAAWTTAGRMIPYADMLSMYLSLMTVIVAFQMAIWPERAASPDADDSAGRLVMGLLAMTVLALQATRAGRRAGHVIFAGAAVALLVAAALFLIVRLPYGPWRGWLVQYGPVWLAGCTPPLLLLAERFEKSTGWRAFAAPVWMLSLLFIPAVALAQLLSEMRLAEGWIRPATLLILAGTYVIAGLREHRRPFLVLAAVLCLAAWK